MARQRLTTWLRFIRENLPWPPLTALHRKWSRRCCSSPGHRAAAYVHRVASEPVQQWTPLSVERTSAASALVAWRRVFSRSLRRRAASAARGAEYQMVAGRCRKQRLSLHARLPARAARLFLRRAQPASFLLVCRVRASSSFGGREESPEVRHRALTNDARAGVPRRITCVPHLARRHAARSVTEGSRFPFLLGWLGARHPWQPTETRPKRYKSVPVCGFSPKIYTAVARARRERKKKTHKGTFSFLSETTASEGEQKGGGNLLGNALRTRVKPDGGGNCKLLVEILVPRMPGSLS